MEVQEVTRGSGILLAVSSLPSPYGIGTLGDAARQFVDLLVDLKQKYWQILPVGPTSYGDSPYHAQAGNVKSMSSGGQSISFGSNETLVDKVLNDKTAQNRLCYDTVCEYLSGTGLLYAGVM